MELRKIKEQEHANKLKLLLEGATDEEKVASNKMFYSIARISLNYVRKRLLQRVSEGKKILDYCCGDGDVSIFLAKNNADITGIDISDVSIENAKKNAQQAGLKDKPVFLVMDGEKLEFEENTFDFIICSGVLHHLDIQKAYAEMARVLKPGGEIICIEPLAYNPFFQLYRKLTPKLRTEWEVEHILSKKSINLSKNHFNKIEMRFYHLATLLAVPCRHFFFFDYVLSFFETVDSVLLKLPLVKWLAWQVVFIVSVPKNKT